MRYHKKKKMNLHEVCGARMFVDVAVIDCMEFVCPMLCVSSRFPVWHC